MIYEQIFLNNIIIKNIRLINILFSFVLVYNDSLEMQNILFSGELQNKSNPIF